MSLDPRRIADLVEIHELCSRYMAYASQFVVDKWLEVFTPDGEYGAFGTKYPLAELLAAAPRGQFIGNMPVVEFAGEDCATGIQHYVFIDQKTHAVRLAWYEDEYRRTSSGWRIHRRSTTFLRKHGGFDSGRQRITAPPVEKIWQFPRRRFALPLKETRPKAPGTPSTVTN